MGVADVKVSVRRAALAVVLALAGVCALAVGAWQLAGWAGVAMVAGAVLVFAGFVLTPVGVGDER